MTAHLEDSQVIGETESTLFTLNGLTSFSIILKNSGVNTANYRLQYYSGSAWSDLGAIGTDYYNTLSPSQVRSFQVTSGYPKVQILGNASGGAFLEFSVSAYINRADGGSYTILPI